MPIKWSLILALCLIAPLALVPPRRADSRSRWLGAKGRCV